jgi:hypothetical protein
MLQAARHYSCTGATGTHNAYLNGSLLKTNTEPHPPKLLSRLAFVWQYWQLTPSTLLHHAAAWLGLYVHLCRSQSDTARLNPAAHLPHKLC